MGSRGVYLDLTARIDELPFKDTLAPAHMKVATRAGLDPEKPSSTMAEMVDCARRIQALGGDVSGYFWS